VRHSRFGGGASLGDGGNTEPVNAYKKRYGGGEGEGADTIRESKIALRLPDG